jgi:hypothetical protein
MKDRKVNGMIILKWILIKEIDWRVWNRIGVGRNDVVGIATYYVLEGPGIVFR